VRRPHARSNAHLPLVRRARDDSPALTARRPPEWVHWDGDTYAKHFHGRELTRFEFPKGKGASTTYRNDYPVPPLHWQHPPPPDHGNRPPPPFGHTTSHRADFCEHKFSSAMQRRSDPRPTFKPKLSGITTCRNDFKAPQLPPRRAAGADRTYNPSGAPLGTTTMRADYCEWKMPAPRAPRENDVPQKTKFHGSTTFRNAYTWPAEMPPPPAAPDNPEHEVSPFGGNTEYRAAFCPVPLPVGLQANIGLQVASRPYKMGGQGGQFDLMLKQGQPAPCSTTKTYTTVVDQQQTASIVVVAKRADMYHGVILGHFPMNGIKPDKVGVPKVEVTLKLTNEKTLLAQALYKQGNKMKVLTFQSNKKPLRSVAQASDVPEDY